MEFHPSQIPITKTFEIKNEDRVSEIAAEMVKIGFSSNDGGFRVIMTKERETAKKIGFTMLNEVNLGLRKTKQERDIRYWVYNYDKQHFALVLISSRIFSKLGF